jgi:outer membrane lipoprotein-sorting protein
MLRRVAVAGLLALTLAAVLAEEPSRTFLERPERDRFLGRMEKRMAELRSFLAEFEQTKRLSLFKEPVKSSGFVLFARPDRLRWELARPFRSILVVRGNRVSKFEYVGGKRRALELGRAGDAVLAAMDQIRQWFKGRFDREGKQYRVQVSTRPDTMILLTPRDEALARTLEAIEFVPTRELDAMERVTIRERNGDSTVMVFVRRTHDVEPPEAAFSLEDPADLDLERLRSTAAKKTR